MKLNQLRALGFDQSYHIAFSKAFRVRCSQCEALCINGMPTHEQGCPNQTHTCKGCDAIINYNDYCKDCR